MARTYLRIDGEAKAWYKWRNVLNEFYDDMYGKSESRRHWEDDSRKKFNYLLSKKYFSARRRNYSWRIESIRGGWGKYREVVNRSFKNRFYFRFEELAN